MKPSTKKILLYLFLIGVVAAGVGFYFATKKASTAADSKPVKTFTAEELVAAFEKDRVL